MEGEEMQRNDAIIPLILLSHHWLQFIQILNTRMSRKSQIQAKMSKKQFEQAQLLLEQTTIELKTRSDYLKTLEDKNRQIVDYIKQCQKDMEKLIWSVPQTGLQQNIDKLKMSVRVPLVQKDSSAIVMKSNTSEQRVQRQFQDKLTGYLRQKKDVLSRIDKLKPDGSLYQSHRRVLLKEYLQSLRLQTKQQKTANESIKIHNISLELLQAKKKSMSAELSKAGVELSKAGEELMEASRLLL